MGKNKETRTKTQENLTMSKVALNWTRAAGNSERSKTKQQLSQDRKLVGKLVAKFYPMLRAPIT